MAAPPPPPAAAAAQSRCGAPSIGRTWGFTRAYATDVWAGFLAALPVAAAVEALVPRRWLLRWLLRHSRRRGSLAGGACWCSALPQSSLADLTAGGWVIPSIFVAAILGTLVVLPTAGEIPILQGLAGAGVNAGAIGALLISLPGRSVLDPTPRRIWYGPTRSRIACGGGSPASADALRDDRRGGRPQTHARAAWHVGQRDTNRTFREDRARART